MVEVDWRAPFINFINEYKLPLDTDPKGTEAARLVQRCKGYALVGDNLYKCGSPSGVLMKCILTEEGKQNLDENHDGSCGNHAASKTLVRKAFLSGFYYPTALADAKDLVRQCSACQFIGKQAHDPAHNLITIPPSWPFDCWSIDMIGPLTTVPGGFTHVLVAVDKFPKWIEYNPITKISIDKAVDFICDILHRFGFPLYNHYKFWFKLHSPIILGIL